MASLIEKINQGKVLVSDGAWGTFLHQSGLQPGECPELWNVTNPDAVYKIAKSYVDAGADIVPVQRLGKISLIVEAPFQMLGDGALSRTGKAGQPEYFTVLQESAFAVFALD